MSASMFVSGGEENAPAAVTLPPVLAASSSISPYHTTLDQISKLLINISLFLVTKQLLNY